MMRNTVSLSDARVYSSLMTDYVEGHPRLRHFYRYEPHLSAFQMAMEERDKFPFHRDLLAEVMNEQHQDFYSAYPVLSTQVQHLRSRDTYTVTAGHQLCLATGPLFFLYKIASAIRLCRELHDMHPGKHFVPVYWMASEDHDFEEIRSIHVFGKTLTWESSQQGATGRMHTGGIHTLLDELEALCATEPFGRDLMQLLRESYLPGITLAAATRRLVLSLFGHEGLLVVDADHPRLKQAFLPVMREEIALAPSYGIVKQTSEALAQHYKVQVNPRGINLFYLDEQLRERIVQDDDGHFRVLNTDLRFGLDLLLDVLEKNPRNFSPNVVLRPLYQEIILPNLAVIGGPGELAYWLQLKSLFEHFNVSYPVLVPRANALLLKARMLEKAEKAGLALPDIFRPFEELSRSYLRGHDDLSPEIDHTRKALETAFTGLAASFADIDPTLKASVMAELQKSLSGLEQLGRKGMAALKRSHELQLSRIRSITDTVSPGGTPQERHLNFADFYAQAGPDFVRLLPDHLSVLKGEFTVLVY